MSSVSFWRPSLFTALISLWAATSACGPSFAAADRESLIHIPIPAEVARRGGQFAADWSSDLVARDEWSAHVHVIPQGQLVPAHHHPKNDELVFVAMGSGTWMNWQRLEDSTKRSDHTLTQGSVVAAPPLAVHGVRNEAPEPLATVVIHRPEFGQNWYVLPSDVRSSLTSAPLAADESLPAGMFEGWTLGWLSGPKLGIERKPGREDWLYLVGAGSGLLSFEDNKLPMEPGTFVKVPPGLNHRLSGEGLRVYRVIIPRS